MPKPNACVDCGQATPETLTEYSLISKLGWRLQRTQQEDGSWRFTWRCPECWRELKKKKVSEGEEAPVSVPTGRGRQR